jgi:hypothetical protein
MDFAGKFMDQAKATLPAYERASQAASEYKAKPKETYSKEEVKSKTKDLKRETKQMVRSGKKNMQEMRKTKGKAK